MERFVRLPAMTSLARSAAVLCLLLATSPAGAEVRTALRLGGGFPSGIGTSLAIRPGIPLELEVGTAVVPMVGPVSWSARAGVPIVLADREWGGRWTLDVQPSLGASTFEERGDRVVAPWTGAAVDLAYWPLSWLGVNLQFLGGAVVDRGDILPVLHGATGVVF